MTKLLVVADDLTGSLDTGIQFAKCGLLTKVEIEGAPLDFDRDVTVLDTESRHITPKDAYYEVFTLIRFFRNVDYIYKKTDSTLRGNIGAELKAILDNFNSPIFFIPAYPEQGRVTKNGIQYVDGKPIAESVFAKDPLNPVRKSFIPDIIREQADIKTFVVTKDKYESVLNEHLEAGVYIFDGETREDLDQIGRLLKEKNLLKYTAGSAGFAETLTRLIGFKSKIITLKISLKAQPLIVICGSINEKSLEQIEYIKKRRRVLDIVLSPKELFKKKRLFLKTSNLKDYEIVVVRTVEKPSNIKIYEEYARANSIKIEDLSLIVVRRLGEIAHRLLIRTGQNTLVVFGGDTFSSIVNRLHIKSLIPLLEIDKGVVLSTIEEKLLFFITKAGGFGDKDIIERVLALVRNGNLDSSMRD